MDRSSNAHTTPNAASFSEDTIHQTKYDQHNSSTAQQPAQQLNSSTAQKLHSSKAPQLNSSTGQQVNRSTLRSFVCSFVRSFVRLFVCSFVRSFVRSFVCLFVRRCVDCLLTHFQSQSVSHSATTNERSQRTKQWMNATNHQPPTLSVSE